MKVLHVLDTLETGGSEMSTLEIARKFRHTEVLVAHLYPGRRLRPRFEAAGLRVISLDLPGRYAPFRGVSALVDLIRRDQPDVLHSSLFRASLLARWAARRTGLPLVESLVGDPYATSRRRAFSSIRRWKLRGLWLLDAATARWVTRFVPVSQTLAERYQQTLGISPERMTVIHRGRDPERYAPASAERRADLRRRFGIGDEPLLIQTARLLPHKGQTELVEAFAAVVRRVPESRLWLAGEGPQRPVLERIVRQRGLDRARLLGNRMDVPNLLAIADLFAFPSHLEGHPGALIEAMLTGLPIVASDIPMHRETLEPGHSGILTPLRDPPALAAAMLRLLRDRPTAERLGREARRVACERFSIETIAARHEALYREVAGESA